MASKLIRNELLNDLAKQHVYEIVTWPAYYSDAQCMDMLRTNADPNVILYIALMKGITPIITVAGHKAFVADLTPQKSSKRLPKSLDPSCSSIEPIKKHLRDQRD